MINTYTKLCNYLGSTHTIYTSARTINVLVINRLMNTTSQNICNHRIKINTTMDPSNSRYYSIINTCIADNTMILMADGSWTKIQNIRRGQMVAGDPEINTTYCVSKVIHYLYPPNTKLDIMKFNSNSISDGVPFIPLIITPGHKIFYKDHYFHAKLFLATNDVITYNQIDSNNELINVKSLWDLQFDTIGSYVANGVQIRSKHPLSFLSPLDKNLYHNPDLCSNETYVNDEDYTVNLSDIDTI